MTTRGEERRARLGPEGIAAAEEVAAAAPPLSPRKYRALEALLRTDRPLRAASGMAPRESA